MLFEQRASIYQGEFNCDQLFILHFQNIKVASLSGLRHPKETIDVFKTVLYFLH